MNESMPWSTEAERSEGLREELGRLNDKLDRLTTSIALLDRRRSEAEEMVADMMPAANGAVRLAADRLWELEKNGVLETAREGAAAAAFAARQVAPADLRDLAMNAGLAVRMLGDLTGPEMATLSERTVRALREARTGTPPTAFALARKLRQPHVRRGLGAALAILEALGEGAHPVTPGEAIAPTTSAPPRERARPAAAPMARPAQAAVSSTPATAPRTGPDGRGMVVGDRTVPLDADGFLVDPADWSPDVAETLAAQVGIGPLDGDHWKVIEFCRSDAGPMGVAPGLRRITKELEISPKDMYRLFPKGPGMLAARLAGLGKPKSCV
ncbi:MAG: TusE/DsrC/DsvC family sulfur relay protein [Gemmatimonadota bacterium]